MDRILQSLRELVETGLIAIGDSFGPCGSLSHGICCQLKC